MFTAATDAGDINYSKGYHLATCHSMALSQVLFTKIRNLAQFALGQVPDSHFFKCSHPLG